MQAVSESKGAFARRINVSAGRVSQYIAAGKIHGDALDGEGRSARIVIDRALEQLKGNLDFGQMAGNGLATRLGGDALPPVAAPPPATARPLQPDDAEPPLKTGRDLVADQIALEKLQEIRSRRRRQEIEDRASAGIYTRTADVEDALRKVGARVLAIVDGGLADMASEIAAQFKLPQRDVLHILRLEMRKVRARAELDARREAADRPAHAEDPLDDVPA